MLIVKAAPIFELSSVSIRKNGLRKFDDIGSTRVDLYGYIQLIDENDNKYVLFEADEGDGDDPETVYLWNDISVVIREAILDRPPWLPKIFWLELCLKDKIRDIEIVNDKKRFDFSSIDGDVGYSEKSLLFQTKGRDVVHVRYRVLEYAVLAYVEIKVVKNEENNDSIESEAACAVVTGNIVSMCKITDKVSLPRVLFDKNCYDPSNLVPSQMSWIAWLAVPAYSGLLIEANLEVNDEKIRSSDALYFEVADVFRGLTLESIVGEKWRIEVSVTWANGYQYLREDGVWGFEFKPDAEREGCPDVENVCIENSKRSQVHPNQQSLQMSSAITAITDGIYDVFCCDNGNYVYADGSKKILRLEERRRCYVGEKFGIHFDLKDLSGLEISCGYLSYCYYTATSWQDKRICSVVRGEYGFAVVHYAMFSDALQAKVKVTFSSDNGCDHLISGSISARYSGYGYDTSYEKKYFHSILFDDDEFVEISNGGEVPLLKSAVAVPENNSLVVKAYIRVKVAGKIVKLNGKATFKPQDPSEPQIIKGPNFFFSVTVGLGRPDDEDFNITH
ncbi:hypothetical protein SOVF_030430 [Spinacia oleracea]|nr:hypothetical protein SOVF_030430 [Spinacia oleracea]